MRAAGLFLLLGTLAAALPARGALRPEVSPAEIQEGLGWSGGTLRVRGEVPPWAGIVVRVLGEARQETWVLRERRGPFWLPGKKVAVGGAPEVFLVRAERPLSALLLPEEARGALLGEEALEEALGLSGEKSYLASELFRLWRASGRLAFLEGGISREGGRFEAAFTLPARLSEGTLRVEVFACREGRIEERGEASIPVRRAGLAAFLSEGARRHPLLYGLGAALLALFLGLLVGAVFPHGRGH
ncbi:MAG: TIGR02186 family protein [Acidobacteriota bacterium]